MGILLHFGGDFYQDYPTTVESISILDGINDDVEIDSLSVCFDDDSQPVLHQELLERIFGIISSKRVIKTLHFNNNGFQEVTFNRCFDFLLRCLSCPGGRIKELGCGFEGHVRLTLPDATRLAATILQSNDSLKCLCIGHGNFTFSVKNTFEILFSAVLDRGIPCLVVRSSSNLDDYNTLIRRACSAGNSKLATNTTLKQLDVRLSNGLSVSLTDDDINPVSEILKTNTGLEYINIDGNINLSNTGVRNLMDGVRDNSSLTYGPVLSFPNDDRHNHPKSIIISSDDRHNHPKSIITTQIYMNKFWGNFTTKYNVLGDDINNDNNNNDDEDDLGNNHDDNNNNDENQDDDDDDNNSCTSIVLPNKKKREKEPPKTIALCMYSRLLYTLTAKPQFLFQFLKSESALLFGHQDLSSNIDITESVASNNIHSIENGNAM